MTKEDILSQSIYLWSSDAISETAFFMKSRSSWSFYWEGEPKKRSEIPYITLFEEYNRPVITIKAVPRTTKYEVTCLIGEDRQPMNLIARAKPRIKRHSLLVMCAPDKASLIFDGEFAAEALPSDMIASDLFGASIVPESGTNTIALWDYAFLEKEYSILCGMPYSE